MGKGDRWAFTERQTEILETLKAKARAKSMQDTLDLLTESEREYAGQRVA